MVVKIRRNYESISKSGGKDEENIKKSGSSCDTGTCVLHGGHITCFEWKRCSRRTWNGVTYAEETITLKMAQYCKEELEKYSGIVVYMTRFSNNVDMDRYDRVKVAKDLGADALVSLHINSTGNQQDTVSGALAYVPISTNKADYAVEARALAADIVSNLSTVGMKNLGYLKGEGLGIIYYGRQWKIPTMIIEHGFVNNPSDCLKYYGSDAKIKAVAVADATAIARQ